MEPMSGAGLSRYVKGQNKAAENARKSVTDKMGKFIAEHPDATPEQVRDWSITHLGSACSVNGNAAGQFALDQFSQSVKTDERGRAAIQAMKDSGYHTIVPLDRDGIDRTVHYQMQKYLDGDVDGYLNALGEAADYYTRKVAADTTRTITEKYNTLPTDAIDAEMRARRQHRADLRRAERRLRREGKAAYMRVTQGTETCNWCRMLASRGAVYYSRETAEMGHSQHRNCHCIVVAAPYGTRKLGSFDADREKQVWSDFESVDRIPDMSPAERVALKEDVAGANIANRYARAVPHDMGLSVHDLDSYDAFERGQWKAAGDEIHAYMTDHPSLTDDQQRAAAIEILRKHFPKHL